MINLEKLNFEFNWLEPYIDAKTVETHYTKHHQWYVNKVNLLIEWTEFENMELEDVIMKSSGEIFNNTAQVWNHTFYWNWLDLNTSKFPTWNISESINTKRWSFENFKTEFTNSAVWNFGSWRTWLVKNKNNELEIINTSNAATPMTDWLTALLTVDVREHAYYLKYQNRRPEYLENWFNLINWDRVEELFNK